MRKIWLKISYIDIAIYTQLVSLVLLILTLTLSESNLIKMVLLILIGINIFYSVYNFIHTIKIKKHNLVNKNECFEIIQLANTVIIKFNTQGNITFFNNYAEQLYGYKTKEIAGKNIFDILAPQLSTIKNKKKINKKAWMKRILLSIQRDSYGETWNFTNSGKKIYMGWTSKALKNSQNEIIEILAFGTDLTEQKIMYNLLKNNKHKFRTIFNSVNDGIIILSRSGIILEQNEAILKNFGISRADVASSEQIRLLFLKLIPDLKNVINKVFRYGEVIFDHEFKNSKGEKMIIEIRANKINYNGEEAVLAVGRNILNKKLNQQKIFNAALMAEEKERSRIAKELHDCVSPILATIKLYTQSLKDTNDEIIRNSILLRTEETINESIQSITEISNNLSPHILENFGLVEATKSFCDKIMESHTILINIKSTLNQRLSQQIEIVLYRVLTELINNTIKYAEASQIFINFDKNRDSILLNYIDNGKGFDYLKISQSSKGMGLYNISNRINSIGGQFNLNTEPGKGVEVSLFI